MDTFRDFTDQFLAPLTIIAVVTAILFGLNAILLKYQPGAARRTLRRQVIMLVVTLIAFFLLILLIPMENEALRYEILKFFGIIVSAAIALSSTTFLGNMLAGILLRSVRSFRTGDLIYIETSSAGSPTGDCFISRFRPKTAIS